MCEDFAHCLRCGSRLEVGQGTDRGFEIRGEAGGVAQVFGFQSGTDDFALGSHFATPMHFSERYTINYPETPSTV